MSIFFIDTHRQGPGSYKNVHAQLSMEFIMLINVKMPTTVTVGILTFISMINTSSGRLKARKIYNFQHFRLYTQLKFHAQLI